LAKTQGAFAVWRDDEVAPKVAVEIASGKSRLVFVPVGGDSAAPHHSSALDLEDVGKVAADGDLEIEPRLLGTVVGDVQVFVDGTLPDRSAQLKQQCPRLDHAVLCQDPRVCHKYIGGEVSDRSGVQEFPVIAVCVDLPGTDDPRSQTKNPHFVGHRICPSRSVTNKL